WSSTTKENSIMPITVYEHAADFLAVTEEHLLADEVANALLVGISQRVAQGEGYSEEAPFFAAITDHDGALIGATAMTPPYNVILALGTPSAAMPDLIATLRDNNWPVPGVIGPKAEAQACAAAWADITGQRNTIGMRQRVYELRAVKPPARPASGQMRVTTLDDIDLITAWMDAFMQEAIPDDPPKDNRPVMEQRIAAGDIFVWEDEGQTVSVVAKARPVGSGITVNYVYTPPEHRRQGYASSSVAALSQHCLDMGYRYCTLFTDLDNPTSNDIYMQIGYEPVCDFMMIHFGE
ncbi:GNAT family N-acetyltransferase, partial [Chloroflexota bacterium]